MKQNSNSNLACKAWLALGGLIALGVAIMAMRELPAMRRELRIFRM